MTMQALADTAAAVEDTAALPDESVEGDAPETETTPLAPETAPAKQEEPTEPDIVGLLSKFDDKDLESLEPVKSLLNRKQESQRRTTEHELARRTAAERETWAQSGQWTADLASALAVDEFGSPKVDNRKVNAVANGLLGYSIHNTMSAMGQIVDSTVSRELKVPREIQSEVEDATREFMLNPAQGKDRLLKSWMAIVQHDAVEKATPDIERKLRRQWENEQKVKEKAVQTANADQANAGAGTATRVGGGSAGSLNIQSWDDAAEAFADKKITAKQYGEYRQKYGKAR